MSTKVVNGWMPNSAYNVDSPEPLTHTEFEALEQAVTTISGNIIDKIEDFDLTSTSVAGWVHDVDYILVVQDGVIKKIDLKKSAFIDDLAVAIAKSMYVQRRRGHLTY